MLLDHQNISDLIPGEKIWIAKSFSQPICYEYVGDSKVLTPDENMYFIPVMGPHFMINKEHPETTDALLDGNIFSTEEECITRCRELSLKTIKNFNTTLFDKNPIIVV